MIADQSGRDSGWGFLKSTLVLGGAAAGVALLRSILNNLVNSTDGNTGEGQLQSQHRHDPLSEFDGLIERLRSWIADDQSRIYNKLEEHQQAARLVGSHHDQKWVQSDLNQIDNDREELTIHRDNMKVAITKIEVFREKALSDPANYRLYLAKAKEVFGVATCY